MSTPAEQGIAVQHTKNLPAEDPTRQDRICTVEDPFFGEDVPKAEGDPYEVLLKPLLVEDSKRCDAWKDEVQNILIFAGLFSAVVTAFIIESYQKLRADPNDQIVTLLARISDQLASSPNNTTSPLIPNANAPFTPTRSDVRVNVFWFISLVLSLTVALIGIITLQWLREHQRYDSSIEPMKAFGIFNARSDSLRRWHVPQIFAVLPLLLQGALLLFFVGLTDFLFAIRIDVAIPVVVSVGIPISFLVTTTLLPTLQLYAMEFPYLLSVNYRVPSPCPYKSPQSLISRRIAIFSETFFHVCAYIFATIYTPFVHIIRMFVATKKPFSGESAPFHGNIDGGFKHIVTTLREFAGDWVSLDLSWLATRTSYAVIIHTPDNLRGTYPDNYWLMQSSLANTTGFYDCVRGMVSNPYARNDSSFNAAYHCGEELVGKLCSTWDRDVYNFGSIGNVQDQMRLMRGRCMAVMAILAPETRLPTIYLQTRPGEVLPNGKVLHNAYRAALMDLTQPYDLHSSKLHKISQRWMESHMRFIAPYLLESTQSLFECRSTDIFPLGWMVYSIYPERREIELASPAWTKSMSQQWTLILTNIIQNSLGIRHSTYGASQVCSSSPPCRGDVEHDNVKYLMRHILFFQVREDMKHTSQLLNRYCTSASNPIHDLPYVLVIACVYISAVAAFGCSEAVKLVEFHSLLETVSSICGHQTKSLRVDTFYTNFWHWDGLEPALTYIRDNQTQTGSNTPKQEPLENSNLPIIHPAQIKAPDNV